MSLIAALLLPLILYVAWNYAAVQICSDFHRMSLVQAHLLAGAIIAMSLL